MNVFYVLFQLPWSIARVASIYIYVVYSGVATPSLKRFREGVATLDSEGEWSRMRIAIAGKTQSRKYAQKKYARAIPT